MALGEDWFSYVFFMFGNPSRSSFFAIILLRTAARQMHVTVELVHLKMNGFKNSKYYLAGTGNSSIAILTTLVEY